jgi:toxin ParE1/3/4
MSQRRAHLSPLARLDLVDAAFFIAEGTPIAADRFLRSMTEAIERLASRPMLGRSRPELGRNLRSIAHRSYVIIYRPTPPTGVVVVRVLHGARDIPPLFDEDL